MARKTLKHTIEAEGRDKGKVFFITEWPVTRIDSWSIRALLGLLSANVDLPDGFADMGTAALAEIGFHKLGALDPKLAIPLLSELFECVQIIPTPSKPQVMRAVTDIDYDIEELQTLWELRLKVFALHTDFFQSAGPSLVERAKVMAGHKRPNIKTSPK